MRPIRILCLLLAFPSLASATDGVLEINQACVSTGCFPGDAADFPVTITTEAGRSFRLTSDLVLPNENVDAIQVGVANATIDLNGFSIRGVTVCGGEPPVTPVTCAPAGSGSAIAPDSAAPSPPQGIAVRNGSILGMGAYGVLLGDRAEIQDLRVSGVAVIAIAVGRGSIIESTTVTLGAVGLSAGANSIVRNVTAENNSAAGIAVDDRGTVSDSTSSGNQTGFDVRSYSTVRHSTASGNSGSGIQCFDACTLIGNSLALNGGGGANVGQGSNVTGNTVRSNTGFGLSLGNTAGYSNNVVTSNTTAGQVNGGQNRGGNYCANSGSSVNLCP